MYTIPHPYLLLGSLMYTNYYNSKNYDGGENTNTVNVHDDDEAYN